MSRLFLRCAAALLPPSHRERFFAEWSAELREVERLGRGRSLGFVLSLFGAAVRMTRTIRASSDSAYLELSMASLSALLPTAVLAGWAITTDKWSMLGVQMTIAIGIMLVSAGIWSADGRLLDSIGSRVGLLLVLGASIASTALLGAGEFDLLTDQRISVTWPNMAILAGLAVLAGSNYAGARRAKVQLASLYVMAPGALVLVVVAIVNALSASGGRWVIELIFALPAFVLLWACDAIAQRPRVFDAATA